MARAADSAGSHTTLFLITLTLAALTSTAWTLAARVRGAPQGGLRPLRWHADPGRS
ncbi:hypothetical protein Shyhy01_17040 [Streptomyces hygroscopicus subsp. hygroscopicus]|nr:hypothetical protein Shyhy01_17040 [Streptomyces hygroscopicus subsp. hygroscopicus]